MTKYFERIEFTFWNIIVRLLSENTTVRSIVRKTYQVIHQPELTSDRLLIGIISVSGLFFGISISILLTSII
ncbi:MAG: hypothetical protein JEZ00_13875 [Anaerolineaceae bacterium]|nr:hypothetical protein [Anaerolineaceae bacterium]